jgi:hypothetical protein
MSELKKKRGRKPKNFNTILQKKPEEVIEYDSEKENVILQLPITINEIINNDNESENETMDMSIFLKSEEKVNENTIENSSDVSEINSISFINNNINKIITHKMTFNTNTKCWWCKNSFENEALQLPENYYNNTFYCIGNFCSFNCMKSYNIDLNDNLTTKRESLINLLYYLTYSKYIKIIPAPHWLTLTEYGGNLTIDMFRKNSIINKKEYIVLPPTIISRQMQIEESYKPHKLTEVPIDKVNKIYSEIDSEYIIQRRKPLNGTQLNLENTMGIIKKNR